MGNQSIYLPTILPGHIPVSFHKHSQTDSTGSNVTLQFFAKVAGFVKFVKKRIAIGINCTKIRKYISIVPA